MENTPVIINKRKAQLEAMDAPKQVSAVSTYESAIEALEHLIKMVGDTNDEAVADLNQKIEEIKKLQAEEEK